MNMKLRRKIRVAFWAVSLGAALLSCTPVATAAISLASFTENFVNVSILLERDPEGKYILAATFTPPEGYHLYSKDIPITGIDGLGRPTLMELTPGSRIKARGSLIESIEAEAPDFGREELMIYPEGAVTLRLAVEVPPGNEWMEDEVQVTYMACSASLCKPPVVGKIVPIRIPGTDSPDRK